MSLPGIIAPTQAPLFLASGHAIEQDSRFSEVTYATGHSRSRRVRSVAERVVSVSWFLEAAEMLAVIDWYEDVLEAGAKEFSALVANQGPGQKYWRARWVSFETEMLNLRRGRVSGTLLLSGTGSVTGPDLSQLSAEVSIALRGEASVTIDVFMEAEVSIALQGQFGNVLMASEASIALDGSAVVGLPLEAEVLISLDGEATPGAAGGTCAPFDVLADSGITIDSGSMIAPYADSDLVLDACRVLT